MISARGIGILTGFFVGLLIAVVILCICNKNRKLKSEYDERQKRVRGTAYTYGFYTLCIYLAFMSLFPLAGLELPIKNGCLAFCGIFIGMLVTTIYSIRHEAYWGMNNNIGRYLVVFIVAGLLNLLIGIVAMVKGTMCENGIIQEPFVNFLCGIMILIIGVALLIRKHSKKNDDEEEGE